MTDSPCSSPAPGAAESDTGIQINLHLHDTPAPTSSLFPAGPEFWQRPFVSVRFALKHGAGHLNVMASNPAALRASAAAFIEAAEALEALLSEGGES